MNLWKAILATMVIFGTGVVTGGLLVRHSQRVQFLPPPRPNIPQQRPLQPNYAGGARVEFLRRAERDLNLTAAQRERIDKILAASQERTKKIMEPVTPQMHEEIQRTKDQFREVLTSEQRQRFDELLKQQQRPRDPRDPRRPNPSRDRPPESTGSSIPSGQLPRNP